MIIPLGRRLLDGSSGLPEGPNGLGSPPLLFGLAPRGVCRAPDVATGAVGSYPTFSPLPSAAAIEDLPEVLPPADHRGRLRRRFLFCGTVRSRAVASSTPWRYQARRPAESGLSSSDLPCGKSPAITRPAHQFLLYRMTRTIDDSAQTADNIRQ